jgi:hypothetical protein
MELQQLVVHATMPTKYEYTYHIYTTTHTIMGS